MKKFNLLLTAAMTILCHSNAQTTNVGIHVGANFAKSDIKYQDEKADLKFLPGVYAGVFLDIPVAQKLTIQSGVNYVQKGTLETGDFLGLDYKATMRLHYVEIPLNVVWYSALQQKGFYIGAGPAFSFGVAGKMKYKEGSEEVSEKIKFGTQEEDDMKGADIAGNITAGYTFNNGLTVGAVANLGLINLATAEDTKIHNNYFGVKVGYIFRQKSK